MSCRRLLLPSLALAATTALAGCGGSSDAKGSGDSSSSASASASAAADVTKGKSATEILTAAKTAVAKEEDVTVAGKIENEGQKIAIDMTYSGGDASGTLGIGPGKITVLRVGQKSWFKASDSFWKTQAAAQAQQIITIINGRWIVADSSGQFAPLLALASPDFLTKTVLDPSGTITKGKVSEVDKEKCQLLDSSNGSLCVATETGLPLQLSGAKDGSSGTLDFGYEKSTIPAAPKKADTVDFSQLAGGSTSAG